MPASHSGVPGAYGVRPRGSSSSASQLLPTGLLGGKYSTIGQTSTAPYFAAGMSRANASASSRFSASNT